MGKALCGIGKLSDAFGVNGRRTKVLISFDTEDFTDPVAADWILALANICTEEGITAHFEVVGLVAEALEKWGRTDVIEAIKRHVIGTHTWSHSVHPDTMEEADREDYESAYQTIFEHEERSVRTLKRVFGVDRIWMSVPPGNSEPYVVSRVYADLGIHIDLGPTYFGHDSEDLWYAGMRRIPYGYCMEDFHEDDFDLDAILDKLSKRNCFCIFAHPNRVGSVKFWDGLNYFGENKHEFGNWEFSQRYSDDEIARYLGRIRLFLRRIKADPRFRITTAPEIALAEKPRVTIRREDVPRLRAKLLSEFGPVDEPGSLCVADIFCAAVAFLRGETAFTPANAYGFLYEPNGVGVKTCVKRSDLIETAIRLDVTGFLPHEIDVGGTKIGPADFLFAALEALESGADEIAIDPRSQLGSLDAIPLLEKLNYRGTWVHTPSLEDNWCSNRIRWQIWTLRHAPIQIS